MDDLPSEINYVHSSALNTEIEVKIGSLDGVKYKCDYSLSTKDDLLGNCGITQQNTNFMVVAQIFSNGRPLTVPVITNYKMHTNSCNWNEWLKLPLLFSDLARNDILALTVYDSAGASKTKPIGGTTISLFGKYGVFRQGLLDLYVWPNVVADGAHNTTPGLLESSASKMQSLYKLMKKHKENAIPKIDWLDRLSFREMELICDKEKKTTNELYLTVEFPEIISESRSVLVVYYEDQNIYQLNSFKEINFTRDSEILQDNLVEDKHHKLFRSIRSRVPDKDAKPNSDTRDLLIKIVSYPPIKPLTTTEQDLIWKYRFYLCDQKKALVKFLKCVNFCLKIEARQALEIMMKWAPIDIDDALQLLTSTFSHPAVRQYAVNCLKITSDKSLLLYLLQLVQALRYEDVESITNVFREMQEIIASEGIDMIKKNFMKILLKKCEDSFIYLLSFLFFRACHNFTTANYFFWYLTAECEDNHATDKFYKMYLNILTLFMQALKYGDTELNNIYIALENQKTLLTSLVEMTVAIVKEPGNRTKKMAKLQSLLCDDAAFKINLRNFDPIPFPLDPDVAVHGILPENALLFKSQLMPSRLTFLTTDGLEYVAIFKYGDDLRQDQLVMQVITLIDNLLLSENLDLKLTPYKIIATSTKHGFVQCIESFSVADVLSKEGNLQAFFRKHHPSKHGTYGISSEVMDTYIKSCAGYSVITYLLGVGDRHLDNLMITKNGNLFHIDFGYILGRDPKPMPPPMKLSSEMVDAMGGINSEQYSEFKKLCFTTFLILRSHADLILNLFLLMSDANIPDIALEPDKAVKKLEEKLCLELGDEEAVQHLQNLIDSSVADVMATFVDQLHKFTQYYRS